MSKPTIVSPLNPEMLRVYESADPEEKRRMQMSLRSWLQDLALSESRTLEQIMDEVGNKAKARGMTPEILDSILKGN